MALLAFSRSDLTQTPRSLRESPRRRYALVIVLTLALALFLTRWSTTLPTFAAQTVASELGSWVLFMLVFLGVAWWREEGQQWRVWASGLLWVSACLSVAWLAKRGLVRHFLSEGVADQPRLYWGLLLVLPVGVFWWQVRRYARLRRYGASLRWWQWQIAAGVLFGMLVSLHFFTTVRFSGAVALRLQPWPYIGWSLAYELYQSLGEEAFFRGVLFRALQHVYQLNFWQATLITTLANISVFAIKLSWSNPINAVGVILYTAIVAVGNCFLYRRYQSIMPGWIANVFFGTLAIFRG